MKTDIFITRLKGLGKSMGILLLGLTAFATIIFGCIRSKQEATKSTSDIPSMIIASDLSNQKVTAFAEDSVGRIWIGTFRGLNRYNSYDYHQYYCTDDSIDLPDNQINDLYYDRDHRLWVATIAGVAMFDNRNHFTRVHLEGFNKPHASQILESDDKRLLVNFNEFLAQYDRKDHVLRPVLFNINPRHEYTVTCGFDRRNRLWIATNTALRCYQGDNYELTDSVNLPNFATAIYMDKDRDQIWLGGDKWLAVYDVRGKRFETLKGELTSNPKITNAFINNIHPYEGGYWLFNTANHGVLAYNINSDRLWSQDDTGFPFEMPPYRINRFFTDSHKNLWVGSYNNGVAVINKYKRQFNSNNALQSYVNGSAVSSVDNDADGNLWCAAAQEGLICYNMNTGDAHRIDAHQLSGDSPTASLTLIKCAQDGTIWVGSLIENKLWRCRWSAPRLEVIKRYDVITPHSITEDTNGDIWIGTGSKWLLKYDANGDTFKVWDMPDLPANACFVSGIECADDKMYVTAFMRPLMQISLDGNDNALDTINIEGWDDMIRRSVFIPTDLLYDSYGLLWIGTVGNGLLCYDPRTGAIESVSGMPCTDISSIIEDKQGHIWVSTQYGIARYDRNTKSVKCYYGNDGLGGNQFFDRAATCLPDGTIVFGATHGLTVFNPLDLGIKRHVPLVFEDIKIHNQIVDPHTQPDVLTANLSESPTVVINDDQNAFSISFAALDYSSKEPANYYYMLEGHDPYWIDARETNEAYYARVAPGTYTFKARIGDGSQSLADEEISIKLKVKANPWRSWWAICIYLAVILTVALVIWNHKKRIRDQKLRIDQILASIEMSKPHLPPTPTEDIAADAMPNDTPTERSETEKAKAEVPQLSDADRKFLAELQSLMEAELGNSEFDINGLAKTMRISRTKLYYKIKTLTGTNPATFFKTYKLNRAAQLLKEGSYTMSEIAERTGYATLAHFSTSFKKHFGMPPSEFANTDRQVN